MGNMGSLMLHRIESFVVDISHFYCSIEKMNKENLDNHPIVVCKLASRPGKIAVENVDILAFWVPFLLVHLGGPDTITAFAIKDNELWLRHLLVKEHVHFIFPADRFKDLMLTKPDPGQNYSKIINEYISKKDANLPTRIQMVLEPYRAAKSANKAKKRNSTELEVVQYGYQFFGQFKGLVVDMTFKTWKFVCDTLGLTGFIDGIRYVYPEECIDKLKEFIFNKLKSKSKLVDDMETAKEISLARGDWKKNLLIHDESLIADCIAKDVCSIVLASEREVLPRSNCRCEELQSTCDKEHSRALELEAEIVEKQQMLAKSKNQNSLIQKQFVDLQVKFQNYKECLRNQKVCEQPNATASNAIFEINKLKAQLQEKDDTIRHLHAEKDILECLTSLMIQNAGYKVTNTNLNKCYHELSKANTHLRTTSLEKIATQKAKIATLKAKAVGKKNSGPTGTPTKSKVLASGMYAISSKYIPPQKRADWVQPTLLPKKKQVTFL
nr:hypothetical protein CTI12_AA530670 [Tanacetum cinerariifolium]